MKKLVFMILFVASLASCSGPTETKTSQPISISLTAEFPLFEGSNTALGEFEVDWTTLLAEENLNVSRIKGAKLLQAVVTIDDQDYIGMMDQLSLQLTTSSSGMQKVGFLNPIPAQEVSFELQTAAEQKGLEALFKEDKIVIVADINMIEDLDDDFVFDVTMTFEFEVKP